MYSVARPEPITTGPAGASCPTCVATVTRFRDGSMGAADCISSRAAGRIPAATSTGSGNSSRKPASGAGGGISSAAFAGRGWAIRGCAVGSGMRRSSWRASRFCGFASVSGLDTALFAWSTRADGAGSGAEGKAGAGVDETGATDGPGAGDRAREGDGRGAADPCFGGGRDLAGLLEPVRARAAPAGTWPCGLTPLEACPLSGPVSCGESGVVCKRRLKASWSYSCRYCWRWASEQNSPPPRKRLSRASSLPQYKHRMTVSSASAVYDLRGFVEVSLR